MQIQEINDNIIKVRNMGDIRKMQELEALRNIARGFDIDGEPVSIEQNKSGHINSTYIITTDKGAKYVLQRTSPSFWNILPSTNKTPDKTRSDSLSFAFS